MAELSSASPFAWTIRFDSWRRESSHSSALFRHVEPDLGWHGHGHDKFLGGEIYSEGCGNNFFEWWYLPGRPSIATGGDTATPPTGGVTTQPQPPQTTSLPPSPAQTNIHTVIISGLSDPAKVIASANVTLTGGLVALGKANAAGGSASTWSPGLRILPDYGLLTGTKIPPVTPNIIDVRIVRQQVRADFPSTRQYPGN